MGRFQRGLGFHLCMTTAILAGGCATGLGTAQLPQSKDTPLALDTPRLDENVTRMQRADAEPPLRTSNSAPSLANVPGAKEETRLRVSVRAWVNGKPIFDDEVMTEVFVRMPPPKSESGDAQKIMNERYNLALDKLVERELIYQDAYQKLSGNKKFMEKLNQAAAKEFDKKLNAMIGINKAKSVDEFKEKIKGSGINLDIMRRLEERDFIANEYIRSRIYPRIGKIGHQEIREYYDQHLNEFQSLDRVEWQDIFLAVGPKYLSLTQARAAAEELQRLLRQGEKFDSLLKHDDGDSHAYRNGFGYGNRKGEIKPTELEQHLFAMKPGEIGPLVELSTGVHLFRLVKREYGGQLPFDEKVQMQITNRLRNDVADREYRQIIRQLKDRAVIELNRQVDAGLASLPK